ncbi:hypothetical protein ACSBR1_017270 [Camellia fascicularis]
MVDAAAHMEIMMQEEEEGQRGSKKSQDGQSDGRRQRGSNPQQSQGGLARSTFPVPSAGSGRGSQGGLTCFTCGQLGHKSSIFPQKGGGQRAASSSARPQGQSQGRGQPLSCYQCALSPSPSPQGYPRLLEHHRFVSQVVEDGDYDLAPVLIGNEKRLVHMHLHIVIGDAIVALNTSFQLGLT